MLACVRNSGIRGNSKLKKRPCMRQPDDTRRGTDELDEGEATFTVRDFSISEEFVSVDRSMDAFVPEIQVQQVQVRDLHRMEHSAKLLDEGMFSSS